MSSLPVSYTHLQGIGFWQAGQELAQAWPLLDALVTLETL